MLPACTSGQSNAEKPAPDHEAQQRMTADDLELHSIPKATRDMDTDATAGVVTPGPAMQKLIDVARRDLASKLNIPETEIETLSAEYVTWRDSSLGCPEAGVEYMQVLTDGSRIRLRANHRSYHYHGGGERRPPFLCRNPAATEPLPYAPGEA
jgi:hypothetical protein